MPTWHMTRGAIVAGLVTAMAVGMSPAALAQDAAYPSRPIRLVVPFPAGGATDVFSRAYADALAEKLKGSLVVENKAGAAGAIGSKEVARAPADGYTLLFGTASTHALHTLVKAAPQYDPIKDFTAIAIVGGAPAAVVVNPKMPATLKELLVKAKSAPGTIKYGSPGSGTFLHLAAERLKMEGGGADIVHVAYRGGALSMADLLGGHIGMTIDTLGTSLPQHKEGKLRILAIAAAKRSPLAPDIPTVDEAIGTKGFVAQLWNVVCAPPALPKPILDKLSKATMEAMGDSAVRQKLQSLGIDAIADSTPETAQAYLLAERARWKSVMEAAGLKAQ